MAVYPHSGEKLFRCGLKKSLASALVAAGCLAVLSGCGKAAEDAAVLTETPAQEVSAQSLPTASVPQKALNDLVYRELDGQKTDGDTTLHVSMEEIRSVSGTADTLIIMKNGTPYGTAELSDEDFDIYLEYGGTYNFYLTGGEDSAPIDVTELFTFEQVHSADGSLLLPLS